jgi:lincosamide nucleotidyltransferase A/C/D/E
MGDGDGKEVDLHVIVLDDEGNGLYGPPEAAEGIYPAEALQGRGTVDGLPVRCTSPEFQMRSHSGYELNDMDIKDVTALADKLGLDLPQEFRMCFHKNR